MTQADAPVARSKMELEALVKQNGGAIFQSETARKNMIIIADKGRSDLFIN
jgi:hypothetical protein